MGDGVSPVQKAINLGEDASEIREVYHDAMETGYTSDAAGGRAAEKSTASADAEMTDKKEQKEEASWTRVGGTRTILAQAEVKTKPKYVSGYLQFWAKDAAAVKAALDELGATQTRPMNEGEWGWCHILYGNERMKSFRSHRVTLEDNEYVRRLSAAAKNFSWVEVGGDGDETNRTRTRMKLDVPGGSPSPSYWQAPTRTAAPVRPEPPQQFHTGFSGAATRRREHERAWELQYPPLQQRPQQEESSGLAVSVKNMMEMMERFMSLWQPPAPAAATPEVPKPKWNPLTNEVHLLQQELKDHKEKMECFVAQWQPPEPAEVPMASTYDPLSYEVKAMQHEFWEYKVMMEQKLKEVQVGVRSQAQAAAAEIEQLKAQLARQQMELDRVRATQEAEVHQVHQIAVEPATPEKTEDEIWAEIEAQQAAQVLAVTKYDEGMFTPPPKPQLRLSFPSPIPQGVANKFGRMVSYTTTAEQQVVPVASTSLSKKQKKKRAQKHKLGGLDSSPALRESEPAPGEGRGRRSPSGSDSEGDISCHSGACGSRAWSGEFQADCSE